MAVVLDVEGQAPENCIFEDQQWKIKFYILQHYPIHSPRNIPLLVLNFYQD